MEALAIKPGEHSFLAAHRDHFMEAMSRVLASRTFSKSARLSAFLRYVCMTTAEGGEKVLCEQNIGTAVFGRPDHYNPSDDTIVRSSARLLRQRLATYYEEEGRDDRFRISIPRGSYVPVLVAAPPSAAPGVQQVVAAPADAGPPAETPMPVPPPGSGPDAPATPVAPAITQSRSTLAIPAAVMAVSTPVRPRWLFVLLAIPLLAGLAFWLLGGGRATPADASDRFWAAMLSGDTDTSLIVADNGLVMYQSEVHRQVELSDYNTNYPGDADTAGAAKSVAHYGARRYTAMSSVTLASELGKRARAAPQRFHVRFARDVHLADLKHGNAILVGVENSNPWWALYRKQFNFHIDWDPLSGDYTIRNDRPRQGEQAVYAFSGRDPGRRGYALIGLKRNLGGDGYTLLLGGTTSAGTDAAIEYLMSPASMAPVMKQALRPDGSIADFEVLLQCVLQANGSTDIQVLGLRVKPS
ncbi:hypothetical protein NHH73_06785 [Oxalobacteraceae bacterium OTU3CINTB1]|nr:hypothetical protein NHH73_06785 [Oxalobacteraceae bacterium OTU3CINTB1]